MNVKEYEKNLFDRLIKKCKEIDTKQKIESIIVTGSFGRHEQTYNNGELKSDIEIGLVFKPWTSRKERRRVSDETINNLAEDFNIMPMSRYRILKKCNYNNSLIPTKKKTLFTYDLYNGSYTLYGKKYIEKIEVKQDDIDIYEAKRIIANRIAEYIYLTHGSNDEYLKAQWKSKIVLALGSAWLILNNKYNSSYKRQFESILENKKLFDEDFIDTYKKSFNFLRNNGEVFNLDDSVLQRYIKRFNNQYKLKKMNKSRVNGLSRKIKYYVKFIKNYGLKKELLLNIEDYILQEIIDNYTTNSKYQTDIANIWHNVLY